jgi:hypothetical protein
MNSTITRTKHILANLSIMVRTDQYRLFVKKMRPNSSSNILDVGVTSDETLKDSNIFERLYKYSNKITAATIEDVKKIKKLYPKINVVKIFPHKRLPYKNKTFDIVVSWATLEHVGNYTDQEWFINELIRVGKKVFITTPNRSAIYEPHTGFFFLHWLPIHWFRKLNIIFGNKFWGSPKNLNSLYVSDIRKMKFIRRINIIKYKTLGVLPSHIIITS